ncbi:glycosyltransferase family 9 protein [Xenorhabdus budapestensis]|uniref:glycosyltransferase family 9 protein n=1 Tax=Xenorhabdus budapestensis TaxID=290110 RepID=UPI0014742F36|nr:glycosyltransferase family 9 protein [Xenorhabdus budapestensis]
MQLIFLNHLTLNNISTSIYLGEPLILFSVSNNRKNSLINNENLTLISGKISEKYPTEKFIISAFPNDIYTAKNLNSRIGDNSKIVMCDSLNSFLALLNNMTLIVVGGICHLSAALKKKLVALYGVTKPENWSPLTSKDICIILYEPENVNNITLDKITNAIFSLLEK